MVPWEGIILLRAKGASIVRAVMACKIIFYTVLAWVWVWSMLPLLYVPAVDFFGQFIMIEIYVVESLGPAHTSV